MFHVFKVKHTRFFMKILGFWRERQITCVYHIITRAVKVTENFLYMCLATLITNSLGLSKLPRDKWRIYSSETTMSFKRCSSPFKYSYDASQGIQITHQIQLSSMYIRNLWDISVTVRFLSSWISNYCLDLVNIIEYREKTLTETIILSYFKW